MYQYLLQTNGYSRRLNGSVLSHKPLFEIVEVRFSMIHTNNQTTIVGLVLAAGSSKRFSRGDKALVTLAGRSLLERSVKYLESQVEQVLVNVNESQTTARALQALKEYTIIHDTYADCGPLGGLLGALNFLKSQINDHHLSNSEASSLKVLTIPVDCPFLPSDLTYKLSQGFRSTTQCSFAAWGQQNHYVCGLWDVSLETQLDNYLQQGNRSIKGFIQHVSHQRVDFHPSDRRQFDVFLNINTEEEFLQAQLHLKALDKIN